MKILELLNKEAIIADLNATDKKGVIEELISPISRLTRTDQKELVLVIMNLDRLGRTGIGEVVGIPHGKLKELHSLILVFVLSRKGVDFESIDNQPVYIFFLLLTPEDSAGLHLKLLARISRILKNDLFRQQLREAQTADEVYAVIQSGDDDF